MDVIKMELKEEQQRGSVEVRLGNERYYCDKMEEDEVEAGVHHIFARFIAWVF